MAKAIETPVGELADSFFYESIASAELDESSLVWLAEAYLQDLRVSDPSSLLALIFEDSHGDAVLDAFVRGLRYRNANTPMHQTDFQDAAVTVAVRNLLNGRIES